jgi:hypothetical protein
LHNNIILDFSYDEIFNISKNQKIIVKNKHSQYYSFSINNCLLESLPFGKILYPSSNTYAAPSVESFKLFKSVVNCVENDEFEEHEISKYKGKWGIIEVDGEVKIPCDYDYIDFLRNPNFFKVCKGNLQFKDEEDNNRLILENAKWGVIDSNNNEIVPAEYDWIDEVESVIWVVYKGGQVFYNDNCQEDYWTIKRGKLGVYNLGKLIIPIEYDTISLSWYRVKDYIFVQNGTECFDSNSKNYDVYTFEGEKIERDKPDPQNHYNSE